MTKETLSRAHAARGGKGKKKLREGVDAHGRQVSEILELASAKGI